MSKIKNTYISERRCPRCNGQERYIKWKNCCHCQKENQKRNYAKNRKENNRIKNNEAFERAKLLGNKRFKSLDKCKKCGSVERYIKNRACVKCLMDKIVAERQFMKEANDFHKEFKDFVYLKTYPEIGLYFDMRLSKLSKEEWMRTAIANNQEQKNLIINIYNGEYDSAYGGAFNKNYYIDKYPQLLINLEEHRIRHQELPLNKTLLTNYHGARFKIIEALTEPDHLELPNFLDIDPTGEFRNWIDKNKDEDLDEVANSVLLRKRFKLEFKIF